MPPMLQNEACKSGSVAELRAGVAELQARIAKLQTQHGLVHFGTIAHYLVHVG